MNPAVQHSWLKSLDVFVTQVSWWWWDGIIKLLLTQQRKKPDLEVCMVFVILFLCLGIYCSVVMADDPHHPILVPCDSPLKEICAQGEQSNELELLEGESSKDTMLASTKGEGLSLLFHRRNKAPGNTWGGSLGDGEEVPCMQATGWRVHCWQWRRPVLANGRWVLMAWQQWEMAGVGMSCEEPWDGSECLTWERGSHGEKSDVVMLSCQKMSPGCSEKTS